MCYGHFSLNQFPSGNSKIPDLEIAGFQFENELKLLLSKQVVVLKKDVQKVVEPQRRKVQKAKYC